MRIIKNLTPKLLMEESEHSKDIRPWYVKNYPFFNASECKKRVKFILKSNGLFERHKRELEKVVIYWRNILSNETRLDFNSKYLVFDCTAESSKETFGMIEGIKNAEGSWLSSSERFHALRSGKWFLAEISLNEKSWPKYDVKNVEETILHEMCHLVYPRRGFYFKDGRLYESGSAMRRLVNQLLKKYGSAVVLV